MKPWIYGLSLTALVCAGAAQAQVPVIDAASLDVAKQNASNTKSIMDSNAEIQKLSQQILGAMSGDRKQVSGSGLGNILQAGLGGGNSVSSAPSWGSLLQGNSNFASFDFGGLTKGGNVAKQIIEGLGLVDSIAGFINGGNKTLDKSYKGSVSTATMLAALTSQASEGVTQRQQSFTSAAGQIGSSQDVKGSIDQNTQIQAQTGLTVNELIGVTNGAVAALNAEQIRRLTQQQMVAKMLSYDPTESDPFK